MLVKDGFSQWEACMGRWAGFVWLVYGGLRGWVSVYLQTARRRWFPRYSRLRCSCPTSTATETAVNHCWSAASPAPPRTSRRGWPAPGPSRRAPLPSPFRYLAIYVCRPTVSPRSPRNQVPFRFNEMGGGDEENFSHTKVEKFPKCLIFTIRYSVTIP